MPRDHHKREADVENHGLGRALYRGDIDSVCRLLRMKANLEDDRVAPRRQPWAIAGKTSNKELATYLYRSGLSLNPPIHKSLPPLAYGILYGNHSYVHHLIELQADVKWGNNLYLFSAINRVVQRPNESLDLMRCLLDALCDPTAKSAKGRQRHQHMSPFLYAALNLRDSSRGLDVLTLFDPFITQSTLQEVEQVILCGLRTNHITMESPKLSLLSTYWLEKTGESLKSSMMKLTKQIENNEIDIVTGHFYVYTINNQTMTAEKNEMEIKLPRTTKNMYFIRSNASAASAYLVGGTEVQLGNRPYHACREFLRMKGERKLKVRLINEETSEEQENAKQDAPELYCDYNKFTPCFFFSFMHGLPVGRRMGGR